MTLSALNLKVRVSSAGPFSDPAHKGRELDFDRRRNGQDRARFQQFAIGDRRNASLLKTQVQDVEAAELVDEIMRASSQGEALVRRVLVRTEQREVILDPSPLNETIRSALRQARTTLGSLIIVKLDLSEAVDEVEIGRLDLERALLNLLLNARDAMAGRGQIHISTRVESVTKADPDRPGLSSGDYALLSVRDSGCGMSPAIQARIFEPFYSTKIGESRGLGLAILFGIVKEVGGYVDVESREGHGSTFKLYLPIP